MRSTLAVIGSVLALSLTAQQCLAEGYQTTVGTVSAESQVSMALDKCSRGTPQNVTGTRMPEKAATDRLEKGLLPALTDAGLKPITDRFADYRFQYVGFMLGSRRIIYVNAFLYTSNAPSIGGGNNRPTSTIMHGAQT